MSILYMKTKTKDFLLEINVETLPVQYPRPAVEALHKELIKELDAHRIGYGRSYAACNKNLLICCIEDVSLRQRQISREVVGPPKRVAFDKDGYLHSGDLMSIREDGRFVVDGRKKDMIKRAGENVYPGIVEDKVTHFEKVQHCAAVGMPDKVLGEKLCIFVQPVPGITLALEDITGYLKAEGAAVYELPERFELVSGWPLTPKNAIDKRRLRAYITAKAVEEGAITKEHGNEYLKKDKISIDDVLEGRIAIEFSQTPT